MNPYVWLEGRLTADPELRFTPSGLAVASFTIATNDRRKDGEEWKDVDPTFIRCTAWRRLAENAAESLAKGDLVIAGGKLKQRDFETREGDKRTVLELTADSLGASIAFRTIPHGAGKAAKGSEAPPADDPWGAPPAGDVPPF